MLHLNHTRWTIPGRFRNFFVETYDARGKNVVKLMSLTLQISRNPYMKMLFMGHRGSGKSTELSLLKKTDGRAI